MTEALVLQATGKWEKNLRLEFLCSFFDPCRKKGIANFSPRAGFSGVQISFISRRKLLQSVTRFYTNGETCSL